MVSFRSATIQHNLLRNLHYNSVSKKIGQYYLDVLTSYSPLDFHFLIGSAIGTFTIQNQQPLFRCVLFNRPNENIPNIIWFCLWVNFSRSVLLLVCSLKFFLELYTHINIFYQNVGRYHLSQTVYVDHLLSNTDFHKLVDQFVLHKGFCWCISIKSH